MRRKKRSIVPRSGVWLALAVLCWISFKLISPYYMETIYGQWVFPMIRRLLDVLHSWMPFSILWILTLVAVYLVWRSKSNTSRRSNQKPSNGLKWLSKVSSLVGILITLFYLLWGFNYKRPGIVDRLQLTTVSPDSNALLDLYYEQMHSLIMLEVARKDTARSLELFKDEIRLELESDLSKAGYVIAGKPRIRKYFEGMLLRWGTAGFYNPWIGEGYLDPGLHPLQRPFILAHELSHAYGVTDEGEANFYALTATLSAENDYTRYVGHLTFLRYILSDLRYYPTQYAKAMDDLAPHVLADLKAINYQMDKYPDILPWLRDAIYSSYLKAQGVSAGLKSYNEIVENYLALRSSKDHLRLLPN